MAMSKACNSTRTHHRRELAGNRRCPCLMREPRESFCFLTLVTITPWRRRWPGPPFRRQRVSPRIILPVLVLPSHS